jgi:hypothetical protein
MFLQNVSSYKSQCHITEDGILIIFRLVNSDYVESDDWILVNNTL